MSHIPNSFDELLKVYLQRCAEVEDLKSSLALHEAEISRLRLNEVNLRVKEGDLQAKLEQELSDAKNSHNIISESLRQQVASLKKQLEDAKQDVDRMRSVINKQASDEKDLQKRLEEAKSDIATRDQTISRQFEEIGSLKWELGVYRVEAATHDQIGELTRKNEELRRLHIQDRARIAELERGHAEWMQIAEGKEKTISELLSERDELKERLSLMRQAACKSIDELSGRVIEARRELQSQVPVQKLATQGPSITRPAETPAIDKWITYHPDKIYRRHMIDSTETINGETRLICGGMSLHPEELKFTGPTDRGPWRKIGELR